jgi:hypothetical protein
MINEITRFGGLNWVGGYLVTCLQQWFASMGFIVLIIIKCIIKFGRFVKILKDH